MGDEWGETRDRRQEVRDETRETRDGDGKSIIVFVLYDINQWFNGLKF